jgi:hypothetical protein
MLVVVGWLSIRALRSPGGSHEIIAAAATIESARTDAPPQLQRGARVAAETEADPAPAEAPASDPASPASSPTTRPFKPGAIRLLGNVTNAAGQPLALPDTRVEIDGESDTRTVEVLFGAYAIDGIAPGSYQVECSSPGLHRERRSVFLWPEETEHREDFVISPEWSVAIRLLTTDGRNFLDVEEKALTPDANLTVLASQDPPPERWTSQGIGRAQALGSRYYPRTRADDRLPDDPDGTCSGRLVVFLPTPVYLCASVAGIVIGSTRLDRQEKVATIEIALDRLQSLQCSMRARVVGSEDGGPLPGVQAQLMVNGRRFTIAADQDGVLRKGELFPGVGTLVFFGSERAFDTRRIELLPGVENDLGTIALSLADAHVRGRIVDRAGNGVPTGACLVPYDGEIPSAWRSILGEVNPEDGRFEFTGLAPKSYVLTSTSFLARSGEPGWWIAPVVVDVSHGSVEGLVVEARPSTPVSFHPVSNEARSLPFWILSQDRIPCAYGVFQDRGDARVALAPGSFRLCVGRDASSVREMPFTVGTEPMTVSIEP